MYLVYTPDGIVLVRGYIYPSMIWSIGRGRRKVVGRCQTAEERRRIFDER